MVVEKRPLKRTPLIPGQQGQIVRWHGGKRGVAKQLAPFEAFEKLITR